MLDPERTTTTPVGSSTSDCSLEHHHERNVWDEQIMADAFGPLGQAEDNENPESQEDDRAPRLPQLRVATSSPFESPFDNDGSFAHHSFEQEISSPSSTRTKASDNVVTRVRTLRNTMYERFPEMTLEFENFVIPGDRERLEWLIDLNELDIPSLIVEENEEDEGEEEVASCLVDIKRTLNDAETDQGSFDSSPKDPGAPRNDTEIIHIMPRDSSEYHGVSPSSSVRLFNVVERKRSSLSGKLESIWSRRLRSRTGASSSSNSDNSDTSMRVSHLNEAEKPSGEWAKRWNWLFTYWKLGMSRKVGLQI